MWPSLGIGFWNAPQMNLADSERMAGVLESAGYECTEDASTAGVIKHEADGSISCECIGLCHGQKQRAWALSASCGSGSCCMHSGNREGRSRHAGPTPLTPTPAPPPSNAVDVLVYNTCSIREKAEVKVYSALGKQVRTIALSPSLTHAHPQRLLHICDFRRCKLNSFHALTCGPIGYLASGPKPSLLIPSVPCGLPRILPCPGSSRTEGGVGPP